MSCQYNAGFIMREKLKESEAEKARERERMRANESHENAGDDRERYDGHDCISLISRERERERAG